MNRSSSNLGPSPIASAHYLESLLSTGNIENEKEKKKKKELEKEIPAPDLTLIYNIEK